MQRNPLKMLVLFFLIVCFVGLRCAAACVLLPTPTVLDEYEQADVVIIARVVSIEKTKEPDPVHFDVRSATMVVERVFKGNVKVQDAISFVQGNGIDCLWMFDEKMIGHEYLLYLNPPDKPQDLWRMGYGRSSEVGAAANDLLYLNNLDKVKGKTRVSGTLDDDFPVAGRNVRIIGKSKTFQTTTDEHGVFEIYGLPPGKYLIAPEMPYGWIIDPETIPTVSERRIHSKSYKAFTLKPKRHAVIDFAFKIDNVVQGHVYDRNGRPLVDASIELQSEKDGASESSQFIDKKGRFKFESVPAGRYKLVVHEDKPDSGRITRVSSYDPKKSTLLTTVIIDIKHGESLRGLKIVVPASSRSTTN